MSIGHRCRQRSSDGQLRVQLRPVLHRRRLFPADVDEPCLLHRLSTSPTTRGVAPGPRGQLRRSPTVGPIPPVRRGQRACRSFSPRSVTLGGCDDRFSSPDTHRGGTTWEARDAASVSFDPSLRGPIHFCRSGSTRPPAPQGRLFTWNEDRHVWTLQSKLLYVGPG